MRNVHAANDAPPTESVPDGGDTSAQGEPMSIHDRDDYRDRHRLQRSARQGHARPVEPRRLPTQPQQSGTHHDSFRWRRDCMTAVTGLIWQGSGKVFHNMTDARVAS